MLCSKGCKDKDEKVLAMQHGFVIRGWCADFKLPEDYDRKEAYLSGRW